MEEEIKNTSSLRAEIMEMQSVHEELK